MAGTGGHDGGEAIADEPRTPSVPGSGESSDGTGAAAVGRPSAWDFIRLARPRQWSKGVFVLIGPMYGAFDGHEISWIAVLAAFIVFGLVSSGGYVVNDIRDREADRKHPRKRKRPIASGAIGVATARVYAAVLFAGALALAVPVWVFSGGEAAWWMLLAAGLYAGNVLAYSLRLKRVVILDVMSLSLGFVLRVLGGCAAVAIVPSTWLLNCTLFLAMFLAFGKRLGERRVMGDQADQTRSVQLEYTDHLLRMVVVMTAVATLITYAGYVEAKAEDYTRGFNLLWLTMLPATFALLRCIVLVERGEYDDPTELASRDLPFQIAAGVFGLVTLGVMLS